MKKLKQILGNIFATTWFIPILASNFHSFSEYKYYLLFAGLTMLFCIFPLLLGEK